MSENWVSGVVVTLSWFSTACLFFCRTQVSPPPQGFLGWLKMAERVGFEPTIPVKVCPLSRRIVSTAHAPLRKISHNYRTPNAAA